jgi:hypothetical protein
MTFALNCLQRDFGDRWCSKVARYTRSDYSSTSGKTALVLVLGPKVKSAKPEQQKGKLIWSIHIVTPLTKKVASVSMFGSTTLVRDWSQYHLIGAECCNVNIYYQSSSSPMIRCN